MLTLTKEELILIRDLLIEHGDEGVVAEVLLHRIQREISAANRRKQMRDNTKGWLSGS